jgi:hypothetical protein
MQPTLASLGPFEQQLAADGCKKQPPLSMFNKSDIIQVIDEISLSPCHQ